MISQGVGSFIELLTTDKSSGDLLHTGDDDLIRATVYKNPISQ